MSEYYKSPEKYEYRITEGVRKCWDGGPELSEEGWEEIDVWTRLEWTEERYWRKPRAPATEDDEVKYRVFIQYVMDFYGPGGVYASFFSGGVTREEVLTALRLRLSGPPDFSEDSYDRELVRDIMLCRRLEHDVSSYLQRGRN
jgi:hypothetical protein